MTSYASLAFTDAVKALQEKHGSRKAYAQMEKRLHQEKLTPAVAGFIQARDSFYMASMGGNGFPYIQHRGGPAGFLRVVDEHTLACLDFAGNKQYITAGNLATNNRVSLILMDYPNRARLKLYATVKLLDLGVDAELDRTLLLENYAHQPERILVFDVQAFDWNCPQHITPRYTEQEIDEALVPYREHIRSLEKEIETLKLKHNG